MSSSVTIGDNKLEMTRYFDYPREKVFDAWTKAEQIEKWWGCAQTRNVNSTIDLRTGGTFRHDMEGDGYGSMSYIGTYEEVTPPERLVCKIQIGDGSPQSLESTVTIEFIEEGKGTRLQMTQVGFPMKEMCGMVAEGTKASLDKLEAFLAA